MENWAKYMLKFEDYDGAGEDSSESYYCYFHDIRHVTRIIKGYR